MKRQISIYIFYGILLLALVAVLLLMNASLENRDREIRIAEKNAADTADAADAAEYLPSSREISAYYRYTLRVDDGQLSVYQTEGDMLYLDTGIKLANLPQQVQARISEGVGFHSEEELFAFLESYSS